MGTPFQSNLRELLNGKYSERIPALDKKIKSGKTLSNEDIAKVISTSKQVVGNWILGSEPKPEMLIRLAKAYGVSIDWLLGVDEAADHVTQQEYAPFKELGFSYKTYSNLLRLKEQNPEAHQAYMRVLNIILEQEHETTRYNGATLDLDTIPNNTALEYLVTFFGERHAMADCWITTTQPEHLLDIMTEQIKDNYNPSLSVPEIGAYKAILEKLKPVDPDMYYSYLMSQFLQELKYLKEDYYKKQSEE